MIRVLVPLLVVALGSGCADQREQYCAAVEEHQAELSELLAAVDRNALLEALGPFRELADEAPPDIRDEWTLLVDRIEALRHALDAAGVDPASYDAEDPPADLPEADRRAIASAARDLGAAETQRALADLEQQALDVCGTPLVM
jgi:hypothetical protein